MIHKVVIVVLATLAVGTGVLWAVAEFAPLHFSSVSANRFAVRDVRGGAVRLCSVENRRLARGPGPTQWPTFNVPFFSMGYDAENTGYKRLDFSVNVVPLVIIFAAYPAVAFMRGPVRRWRRRRKGWCVQCGYDLTANVSGVCPECGRRV